MTPPCQRSAAEPAIVHEATVVAVLKLTILPVLVGWAVWLVGLTGLRWRVAVVTAAMPTGVNAFLLARRVTGFAETSASIVVVITGVSVLSITGLLTWFG